MNQFIDDHFLLFFLGAVTWCVGCTAFMLWRRKKYGVQFPSRDGVNVLFEEKCTSGSSHKSLFTRFANANNCLHVTVTDHELWIWPHFPFSAFARIFDLDHRIALDSIVNLEARGKKIKIEIAPNDGETKTVILRLRRPLEFVSALLHDSADK